MIDERQSQQDFFRGILVTVVGQAFTAAGYHLQQTPLQWAGGRYRFIKRLADAWHGVIEFQALIYTDNAWSSGQASRFRVTLIRSMDPHGKPSADPRYVQRTLSALVVEDFGVAILPSADHWWQFHNTETLGKALAEAGHLIIGYAMPWLSGDLTP